jgi:hypothetical protein
MRQIPRRSVRVLGQFRIIRHKQKGVDSLTTEQSEFEAYFRFADHPRIEREISHWARLTPSSPALQGLEAIVPIASSPSRRCTQGGG